jgi:hypothetical protein
MPDLQLEGGSVSDIIANVFFSGQDLMDDAPRPWPAEIGNQSHGIRPRSDLALRDSFPNEPLVDLSDPLGLLRRPRSQDHAIRLQALVLAALELRLQRAGPVEENAPQAP